MSVLKYNTQGTTEVRFTDLVDVDAIVTDFTILNIVETIDQVGDCGLAGSGGTDKGDLLAGIGKKFYIVKHDLIRVVAEIHAVENNGAFQRNVVHAAVCLMSVFPCPVAAASLWTR